MQAELVDLRSGLAQLQAEKEKLVAEAGEAKDRAAQAEEEREVLRKALEEQLAKGLETGEAVGGPRGCYGLGNAIGGRGGREEDQTMSTPCSSA
ncbi:hypothetical protein A4X06_0g9463 [Tilletia controversa]|uniref:Uncharacterized protein n=1 Tax=Tilletia controversa TaxID=13291 RepID=A0A8X7MIK7_9BASI|nr:hypothetical protein CF336_g9561 [Tilletia laevis]KAE8180294.1 hypothetical protein CF335_g9298 [Tilletia laevis]KAE8236702.1 hypothetical protein A4X06_0g9463 [Tilletia controversa]